MHDLQRHLLELYQSKCDVCIEKKGYCTQCEVRAAIKALSNAVPEKAADKNLCPKCGSYNPEWEWIINPQAHKTVYCWCCGQMVDRSSFLKGEQEDEKA